MEQRTQSSEQGYMIILTMILVFVLTGTGLAIASTVAANYASTKRNTYVDAAVSTAEAGVSATINELTKNPGFTGYPDTDGNRGQFYNNVEQGMAEYGTVVTTNANNTKTIKSTGYVYANNTASASVAATNKKTVEVVVNPKEVEIAPSIFAGPGGLEMNASRGSSGNVYVMGKLNIYNYATIGTSALPVNVQVGNMACGAGSDYPVLCPSSDEPVNISFSASIQGTVCATGQTDGTRIVPASGFQLGCVAQPLSMPYFDKASYTSSMTSPVRTGLSDSCGFDLPSTSTLKANTRYTGNVSINFYCNSVIEGDIYVEGDLNLDTSATLRVKDGLTTPPTIVVNGSVEVGRVIANNLGHSVKIISFKSADSMCSTNSGCTNISSSDLNSSSRTRTVYCRFCNMDGGVLWAYFGELYIHGPSMGVGKIGAAIGNRVNLFGYDYGVNSWTDVPPGSVKMISGYNIINYKQNF